MRIMLIEDSVLLQNATQRFLKRLYRHRENVEIVVLDNADDAINNLNIEGQTFDLIISDYDLNRFHNGGDVLKFLQSKPVSTEHLSRFVFFSCNEVCKELHPRAVMKPDLDALKAVLLELVP